MSSQLTNLVPVFDRQNYGQWAKAIKAFFMSQSLWGYANGTITQPGAGAPAEEVAAWQRASDMARGNIVLHLTPAVQQAAEEAATVVDLWNALHVGYRSPTATTIYKDFKEAISIQIHNNSHPVPQIDKMSATFACLNNVSVGTAPNVHSLGIASQHQALILMATLPPKWEHLIPIICQGHDLANLDVAIVRDILIAQYENETNKGQHKEHKVNQANKLSAAKRKRGDPSFNQHQESSQQKPSGSGNQQQHRQRGSRGSKRGGARGKGKQCANHPGHSHVASIIHFSLDIALPALTTHTVAHVGPSNISTQVVTQDQPKYQVPCVYPSLNKALTLAEHLDVPATTQTIKSLEQRFSNFNNEV